MKTGRKLKEPIYSHDWFTREIPNWEIWLAKFKNKDNLSFLELGCYEGMATRWLLDNILIGKNCRITVVDTFTGSLEFQCHDNSMIYDNFKRNIGHDKRVKTVRSTTKKFLKKTNELFDFIYIDASHITKDVLSDAMLSWDILKNNGILIFDDYEWDIYPKTSMLHPKPAIDFFMNLYKNEYKLTGKGYQVCLTKIDNEEYLSDIHKSSAIACIQSVLQYFYINFTQDDITKNCKLSVEKGNTTLADIANAFKCFGLSAEGFQAESVSDMDGLSNPAIIPVFLEDGRQYFAVYCGKQEKKYLIDIPFLGVHLYTESEFEAIWNHHILLEVKNFST